VKAPRFRITWVMFAVAIAALNLGAIRAVFDRNSRTSYLLGIGAMPMANVLAVGLLIGHRRRKSRRFLSGFVVFGALALAVYVAVARSFADDLINTYIKLSYNLLLGDTAIQMPTPLQFLPFAVGDLFRAIMLGLPQLAFALIGGFVLWGFGTAERRDQTRC
jgi:hypothetical protein